ncbi:discoidin domain-containing protein [Saccharicrinis sp. GN24d3]|uniref:discoidin domain-containing protein n=1 Tax=Saccharicrinis sp. GN24d3 TaxID=3458416 RepID=UPI004035C52C
MREKKSAVEITFDSETEFNRFVVQEYIALGQRVQEFSVEVEKNGAWEVIAEGTTIGNKRILRFPNTIAKRVRLTIKKTKAAPILSNIEIYKAPKLLTMPVIKRDKSGETRIEVADNGLSVYYTLDGSEPDIKSKEYKETFLLTEPANVKAVAVDKLTGLKSPVASVAFDICKNKWTVVNSSAINAQRAIDGDNKNVWHVWGKEKEIIIDLGETESLQGFTYVPDQARWSRGIISNYEFYVSVDGKNWGDPVSAGEFSNIKNNPLKQTRTFKAKSGRFFKLKATHIVDGGDAAGFGEVGVITD